MHFRIVSPSSTVDIEKVQQAKSQLEQLGHQVTLSEHVFAQHRYLAGTIEQRVQDLKHACFDSSIDAIWCARGGTGSAMLLPYLDNWILNKPILGYSDSTSLLNNIALRGGHALHAPVFQEIASKNLDSSPISHNALECISRLSTENSEQYPITLLNPCIKTQSLKDLPVFGGNLTVLCALQGTDFQLKLSQPSILMLEDVGEPYYRIERCLTQLLQSIDTTQLKAVILGDFYNCPQKDVPDSLPDIFNEHLIPLNIPLFECDWFGHGLNNRPFWIGKKATLTDSRLIL